MNIKYLTEVIIPQRKAEIEAGKNAATAQPIYVVLDIYYFFIEGHVTSWTDGRLLNLKEKSSETGYLDLAKDSEDREFITSPTGMQNPQEVTKLYYDRIIAFFLTRQGAEKYLQYQSHNLSEPYIYTFHSGYRNNEMDQLLNNH